MFSQIIFSATPIVFIFAASHLLPAWSVRLDSRRVHGALPSETAQEQQLIPGDEIDVLGFPSPGSFPPVLGDSIFRKIGSTNPLPPLMLKTFDDAFDHENDLVAVDGTLTQIQPSLNGLTLALEQRRRIL